MTALADGSFVATWGSDDPGDGSGGCIRARVFDADGNPTGADFVVNTTTASDQLLPTVTALADGGFVVTWEFTDTGDGSEKASAPASSMPTAIPRATTSSSTRRRPMTRSMYP